MIKQFPKLITQEKLIKNQKDVLIKQQALIKKQKQQIKNKGGKRTSESSNIMFINSWL
tara:strand:- start:218 stop:391 length:174 start_codon:yes stop_codon:yes gene_type:complete